jgi:hypothetical protein
MVTREQHHFICGCPVMVMSHAGGFHNLLVSLLLNSLLCQLASNILNDCVFSAIASHQAELALFVLVSAAFVRLNNVVFNFIPPSSSPNNITPNPVSTLVASLGTIIFDIKVCLAHLGTFDNTLAFAHEYVP